ncbi:MAG: hypothetical protein AMXMBFR48_09750 [Ignavibacteriales bacterium]
MRVRLIDFCHGRSGDKGDAANVGIIAYNTAGFQYISNILTEQFVKNYFEGVCFGDVQRYELPNIHALNFILNNTLGGGGTVSLKLDAQGKTLAAALLRLEVELSEAQFKEFTKNKE